MDTVRNKSDSSALIAIANEKLNNHELRISRLEETPVIISRLETILEAQVEINKAQSLSMQQASQNSEKTFQAINNNLTKLNMVTERLREDLNKSSQDSEVKIEEINKKVDLSIDKRKIDTSEWGVKIFYWVVVTLSTLALAWALSVNGWN